MAGLTSGMEFTLGRTADGRTMAVIARRVPGDPLRERRDGPHSYGCSCPQRPTTTIC
jgi:hypothetical protein